jgi:hypothetical protein
MAFATTGPLGMICCEAGRGWGGGELGSEQLQPALIETGRQWVDEKSASLSENICERELIANRRPPYQCQPWDALGGS